MYGLVCIDDEWDQAEPIPDEMIDWLNRKRAVEGRLKYPRDVMILGGYNTEIANLTNLPYKTQNVGSWATNRMLVVNNHSMRWHTLLAWVVGRRKTFEIDLRTQVCLFLHN
jgi:hypothetical protein